jgi:2-polyprenyl-3-methyl-5-hydroxy-6-metoxy-1,4-benzoquinol methylase
MNKQSHWQNVYQTRSLTDVSWFQQVPRQSLEFIEKFNLSKDAAIIDIGGGDSLLADNLLQLGYTNITVLDISAAAIAKAKQRLGDNAAKVKWIVSDILDFRPAQQYDCWHDRATFHFLTAQADIDQYVKIANAAVNTAGKIVVATFNTEGPLQCSGLPVKQYNESTLSKTMQHWFKKIRCITTDHITPFNTVQHFIFCSFQKLHFNYGHS